MADCRVSCSVAEVSCRGKGPGVLEGENLRVVPVEAGVLEGLSGLVGRLRQIGQKRSRHPLIHVGHGLPGGHVDGQLVHHALQRVGRRDRRHGWRCWWRRCWSSSLLSWGGSPA